jgi:hypothetical protein
VRLYLTIKPRLDSFLQTASDEDSFLELFRRCCTTDLPCNKRIRNELISIINASSNEAAALKPFDWYKHDTIIPPLSQSWLQINSARLQNGRITNKRIDNVCNRSLQDLVSKRMINDEIVEQYLQLIRARTGAVIGTSRLIGCGPLGRHDREINYERLLGCGQLFIPIHHSCLKHWTFVRLSLDIGDGSVVIEHYDSLFDLGEFKKGREFRALTSWLGEAFKGVEWKIVIGHSPRQRNQLDCGLFMLIGIRTMAFGSEHLSQKDADEHLPSFRARVLAGILCGELDPSASANDSFLLVEEAATPYFTPEASSYVKYRGEGAEDKPFCLDTPSSTGSVSTPQSNSKEHKAEVSLDIQTEGTGGIDAPQSISRRDGKLKGQPISWNGWKLKSQPVSWKQEEKLLHHATSQVNKPNLVLEVEQAPNHKRPRLIEIGSQVEHFARKENMLKLLQSAVFMLRAQEAVVIVKTPLSENRQPKQQEEDLLEQFLDVDEGVHHTLVQRHKRERFSRNFYGHLRNLGGRMNPGVRAKMRVLLRCENNPDSTIILAAHNQATKSCIWTELVDCFSPHLGKMAHVALCGPSDSTTYYEGLAKEERKAYIQGLKARIHDPQDPILKTLESASDLYSIVACGKLPGYQMLIEGPVGMGCITFEALVHVQKAPKFLPLPPQPIRA